MAGEIKRNTLVKASKSLVERDSDSENRISLRSNFFKFLDLDIDQYKEVEFTEEEALRVRTHMSRLVTGASAVLPLICPGEHKCPFAARCQPAGDLVYTVNRGAVPIEDLDEKNDRLWVYHQKQNRVRKSKGWSFKKYEREYSGDIIRFTSDEGKSYSCTPSHLCLAKWNEEAFNEKRCVYLMRRGNTWRVGSTFFIKDYKAQNVLGVFRRARAEQADEAWILGVYGSNTEALMAEEYYSIKWGVSRMPFMATEKDRRKHKGMYAWVSQGQLDEYHQRMSPGTDHIRHCLESLGLHIDCPIWARKSGNIASKRLATRQFFKIHAVNLLPFSELFDFYDAEREGLSRIAVDRGSYTGKVYSLDVAWYHNYVTNGLVTRNCPFVQVDKERMKEYEELKRTLSERAAEVPKPKMVTPVGQSCAVEVNLLKEWTAFYIEEFDAAENSFIELNTCQELAEIEVMLWRLNNNLAKEEHLDLTQLDIVGSDKEGNPLTRRSENVLILAKERLQNRKHKLIKSMVGDRQEKYKREAALKKRDADDPSSTAAKLRKEITGMMKNVEKKVLRLQEAEGNVIDVDSDESPPAESPKEEVLTPESLINDLGQDR